MDFCGRLSTWVRPLKPPLADLSTGRWRLPRRSILHEKTEDSISDPPPLPDNPPLVDTRYPNLLQKYRALSLRRGEREWGQRSELQYRQHHPPLSLIAYCEIEPNTLYGRRDNHRRHRHSRFR